MRTQEHTRRFYPIQTVATESSRLESLGVVGKWVYLEPIFGRGALPHEKARFKMVDEEFIAIMNGVGDDPRVCQVVNTPVGPLHLNARARVETAQPQRIT